MPLNQTLLKELFVEHNLDNGDPRVRDFGFTKGRALDVANALPAELAQGVNARYERMNSNVFCAVGGKIKCFYHAEVVEVTPDVATTLLDFFVSDLLVGESTVSNVDALGPDVRRFEVKPGVVLVAPGPIGIHVTSGPKEAWVAFSNRFYVEVQDRELIG